MTENGIPPYDYNAFQSPDDVSYIKLRKMQTHNIWHVVTGYNTNTLGELALQGFYHGPGPTVYQTLLMTKTLGTSLAHKRATLVKSCE
jgi:ubiquinone biosynthesis protein Coq4